MKRPAALRPGVCAVFLFHSDLDGGVHRLLAQLLAKAGQVGHGEVAVDRLVVVGAGEDVGLQQGGLVVLMDQEVGDDRLQLQGRRRGLGTAAHVNLDAHVVHAGHVRHTFLPSVKPPMLPRSGWMTWRACSSKKGR